MLCAWIVKRFNW